MIFRASVHVTVNSTRVCALPSSTQRTFHQRVQYYMHECQHQLWSGSAIDRNKGIKKYGSTSYQEVR